MNRRVKRLHDEAYSAHELAAALARSLRAVVDDDPHDMLSRAALAHAAAIETLLPLTPRAAGGRWLRARRW
jgi:hypothetical protein